MERAPRSDMFPSTWKYKGNFVATCIIWTGVVMSFGLVRVDAQ